MQNSKDKPSSRPSPCKGEGVKEKIKKNLSLLVGRGRSEKDRRSGEGILIACSGGIDSLALLYSMSELKDELSLKLGVCYVDHKARPESAMEAKFVDKICQDLQVPFFPAEFNDDFWSESKSNFEEKARKERYRLLVEVAINNNFSYIATAHHSGDQAETMLMRILERGTGLKGLCGIRGIITHPIPFDLSPSPLPKGKGSLLNPSPSGEGSRERLLTIIRPMLNISKDEIIEYMADRQYLSDSTNNDTVYLRNLYRKVVIPALKEALPGVNIEKHLSDLAENIQREQSVMEDIMREFWKNLTPTFPPTPFLKEQGVLSPSSLREGFRVRLSRTLIESKSDDFWLTAFSYLFSFNPHLAPLPLKKERNGQGLSHSTQTLIDIVAFIRKRDPGAAYYNPYKFQRDKEGVQLTPAPLFPEKRG